MNDRSRNNDGPQVFQDMPGGDESGDVFSRIVYSLILGLFAWLALWVFAVLTVVQWGFLVFTGAVNSYLRGFLSEMARYISQTLRYLAFASEYRPFPFSPWSQVATSREPE